MKQSKEQDQKEFSAAKFSIQQAILDGISEVIYVADPDSHELLYVNEAFARIWGNTIGEKCYKVLQGLDSPCEFCTNDKIFDAANITGTYIWEFQNQMDKRWYRCIDKAIDWPNGRKVRYEMAIEITKQKEMEEALYSQSKELIELSTPVIQAWEGIVIAPLIGTLDSQRTYHFMDRFLNAIVDTKSPVALVDITGVSTVDTQTAQHLIEAITASRLLGTKAILTGVSPSIAQTLVHLGVDLSKIETHTSLARGLALALDYLGYEVKQARDKLFFTPAPQPDHPL